MVALVAKSVDPGCKLLYGCFLDAFEGPVLVLVGCWLPKINHLSLVKYYYYWGDGVQTSTYHFYLLNPPKGGSRFP